MNQKLSFSIGFPSESSLIMDGLSKRSLKDILKLKTALTAWFVGSVLLAMSFVSKPAQAQVKVGEPAPSFSLQDQFGQTHQLKDYQGKTVVLEWTNPGCPFVVYHYERNTMDKLIAQYPDVVWLRINSSYFTTAKDNLAWAKAEGVKTVLADPSGKVGHLYHAKTTPHMFVVNAQGILVYQGAIDDNPHREDRKAKNYVELALKSLKSGSKIAISETQAYGCSVKYKK